MFNVEILMSADSTANGSPAMSATSMFQETTNSKETRWATA